MWDDVFENCKTFFAKEKHLKSGSGSDMAGPSNEKYSIDIYNKMRFITPFLYNSDGDVLTTNNLENIWKRKLPVENKLKKHKAPKWDKFAENKVNEKNKLTDILSKMLLKFDDITKPNVENTNSNLKVKIEEDSDEESCTDPRNYDYYVKFFNDFLKPLSKKDQDKSFNLLSDEIQKYL